MAEFNIDELATVMGGGDGTWQSSMSKVEGLFAAGLIGDAQLRDAVSKVFNTTNWGEINDLVKSSKNRAVRMSGGSHTYDDGLGHVMGGMPEGYGGIQDVQISTRPGGGFVDGVPKWSSAQSALNPQPTGKFDADGNPLYTFGDLAGTGDWSYLRRHGEIIDRPGGQYGYAMPNELYGFGGGLLHIPEGSSFPQVYAGHLAGLESAYKTNQEWLAAQNATPPDHTFSGTYDDAGNPIYNPIPIEPISAAVPYTGPVNALGEPLLDPRPRDWTTGGVAGDAPSWMWDEWNTAYGTDYSNWDDWFGAKSARAMESFPDHSFLLTDPEGNFFEGNPFNDPNMQIWESTHPWQNYTGGNNVAVPFDGSAGFNAGSMGNVALNPWTFNWGSVPGGTAQPFNWSPVPGTVGSNTVPMNFDPNASIFARTFNDTIPQGMFDPNTSVFFRT